MVECQMILPEMSHQLAQQGPDSSCGPCDIFVNEGLTMLFILLLILRLRLRVI